MTNKQKLILFFIATEFATDQYKLVKIIDRYDFPVELGFNLIPLFHDSLIVKSGNDHHGREFAYAATTKGQARIREVGFIRDIRSYINTLENPEFLRQVTELIIKRLDFK